MRQPAGVRGRHGLDGDDARRPAAGRIGLGAGGSWARLQVRLRGAPELGQAASAAGHLVAELSRPHVLAGAGRGARPGGRADGRPLPAGVRQAVAQGQGRRLARLHPGGAPQRRVAEYGQAGARRRHRTLPAARVLLGGAPRQRTRLQGRIPGARSTNG